MSEIVLSLSPEDCETAARIAQAGGFENVQDYLNHVIREAVRRDADMLAGRE